MTNEFIVYEIDGVPKYMQMLKGCLLYVLERPGGLDEGSMRLCKLGLRGMLQLRFLGAW